PDDSYRGALTYCEVDASKNLNPRLGRFPALTPNPAHQFRLECRVVFWGSALAKVFGCIVDYDCVHGSVPAERHTSSANSSRRCWNTCEESHSNNIDTTATYPSGRAAGNWWWKKIA